MSEDGWVECCGEILLTIGLGLFFAWCGENPSGCTVVGVTFLGIMMVGLPVYLFIKSVYYPGRYIPREIRTKKKTKWGIVVGYLTGFFAWILAILLGIVCDLFAILGVCVFLGTPIIVLVYHVIRGRMKKREEEKRVEALAWDLEGQLKELREQLGRGVITKEKYEQKKKKLLEKSKIPWYIRLRIREKVKEEEKRMEALALELEDQLKELKEQLSLGHITQEEYEQKKKKLLEKSGA